MKKEANKLINLLNKKFPNNKQSFHIKELLSRKTSKLFEKNDEYIKPGLLALGKGGYNIKYLKLHGSMNWLHCPNCQRMYVKFGEKTILQNKQHCRHCMENYKFSENESSIELRGNLLLPTFIKDLSNIQIQLIFLQ